MADAQRWASAVTAARAAWRAEHEECAARAQERDVAARALIAAGAPAPDAEAWRETPLPELDAGALRPRQPRAADTPEQAPPRAGEQRVVFLGGRPQRPAGSVLPAGVRIDAGAARPVPGLADHPYAWLNTLCRGDDLVIELGPRQALAGPLRLVFAGCAPEQVGFPRVRVALGEGATLTLVEEHLAGGGSCPLTEIRLHRGARLDYTRIVHPGAAGWQLAGLRLEQHAASEARLRLIAFAGRPARCDVDVTLAGGGADLDVAGLALAAHQDFTEYHVRVLHACPDARSRQRFRAVVGAGGRTRFDGLIRVDVDAQRSDARQDSHNLLLAARARAQSNPRLEIRADDVRCAHGSSTGTLDADALFYLRSRGLGRAQARAMLVRGFAAAVIEELADSELRARLSAALDDWLMRATGEDA